jgi:predicted exporter
MTPRQSIYLALTIAGTIVPYASLVPWVIEHGLDLRLMVGELFANRISAFFGLDVIVSAVVLWVFVAFEGARAGVRHTWAPIVASLIIGVSAGLPLFLLLRESAIQSPQAPEAPQPL